MTQGTARAAPFYCPYCGEEDLEPYGEAAGGFYCAACNRRWVLRYSGLGRDLPEPSEP